MVSFQTIRFCAELCSLIIGLLATMFYQIVSFIWLCCYRTVDNNARFYIGCLITTCFFIFGFSQALSGKFKPCSTDDYHVNRMKKTAGLFLLFGGFATSLWIPSLQNLDEYPYTSLLVSNLLAILVPILTIIAWEITHNTKIK